MGAGVVGSNVAEGFERLDKVAKSAQFNNEDGIFGAWTHRSRLTFELLVLHEALGAAREGVAAIPPGCSYLLRRTTQSDTGPPSRKMQNLVAKNARSAATGQPVRMLKPYKVGIVDDAQSRGFIYAKDCSAVAFSPLNNP
jgi:hypothetical protein